MAEVVAHPNVLRVTGTGRISPNKLEVEFSRPITDDQWINFLIAIKQVPIASVRPEGWDPINKSDPDDWEAV